MVRAVEGKIFSLEYVDLATGETDRVRRPRELEVDVRKLFGVLSLPRGASAAAESFTVRFGGERSARRTVPRRIHEDQSGQEPDHERKRVRGVRRQDRESSAGFLLFDLPEHAAQPASRIRDGASTLAAVAGAHTNLVRLVFSSGRVRPKRFQSDGRDRVLGHDQQTGLARVRAQSARYFVARVSARALLSAGKYPGGVGRVLSA